MENENIAELRVAALEKLRQIAGQRKMRLFAHDNTPVRKYSGHPGEVKWCFIRDFAPIPTEVRNSLVDTRRVDVMQESARRSVTVLQGLLGNGVEVEYSSLLPDESLAGKLVGGEYGQPLWVKVDWEALENNHRALNDLKRCTPVVVRNWTRSESHEEIRERSSRWREGKCYRPARREGQETRPKDSWQLRSLPRETNLDIPEHKVEKKRNDAGATRKGGGRGGKRRFEGAKPGSWCEYVEVVDESAQRKK